MTRIQHLEQKIENLSFLNDLTKSLNATLDLQKVIDIVASELSNIFRYDIFSLLFINVKSDSSLSVTEKNKNGILTIKSNLYIKDQLLDQLKHNLIKNFTKMTGEDILINNIATEFDGKVVPHKSSTKILSQISGVKTGINIPLCDTNDKKVGIINLASLKKQDIPDYKSELLFEVAYKAAIALKNAFEHKKIKELATRDGLTNTYNRMAFEEILENECMRAIRGKNPLSLIMVDVDNLKKINDTRGHQAGDTVLKNVSQIMADSIRKTDILARYGGDEFAIILPDTDIEKAVKLIERINESLKKNRSNLKSSVSTGVANLSNHPITNYNELIKIADKALYSAKKKRVNKPYILT